MTSLLVKLFVKDSENVADSSVRESYGKLSGITGIAVNVILAAAKLIIGLVSNSISVTADAVNNFSDAGSSAVTLAGFKIAGRPADDDHPFGHGRYEYIAGLIVSFVVLFFSIDLFKSSVERMFHPEPLSFSLVSVIVLSISILGKVWLGLFNRKLGKAINSPAMKAVATDCIGDCAATGVTVISLLLSHFFNINIDSYLGAAVAVIIFIAGINIAKSTLDPLIGQPPEKELVEKIKKEVLSYDKIIGIHDLILHSYGSNRVFGSLHAEVPADCDILAVHDTIDTIERELKRKLGIEISIHMDPVVTDDEFVNEMKIKAGEILREIDSSMTFHDFRVVPGPVHTNFIFDVCIKHSNPIPESELLKKISDGFKKLNPDYFTVVTVDRDYA